MTYRSGLVVGKFCPLHKGHELLINTAIEACEQVVVISYAKPGYARCERDQRDRWLSDIFPSVIHLVIDDAWLRALAAQDRNLRFTEVPHDDEPELTHRTFTAWVCHDLMGQTVDAVFTSEDYGNGFAEVLTEYFRAHKAQSMPVRHICVDKPRLSLPICGTEIRADPFKHRSYLSPEVYADFVDRIVVFGGESSGKTTLCEALAERLNTPWVPEYGRELWDKKGGGLELSDMSIIADTQIRREAELTAHARKFLVCDTSPLTTLFYSHVMFGLAAPGLEQQAQRCYKHTFLCAPDFPFVQDGTRRDTAFRDKQHAWYVAELAARDIDYTLLQGDVETRVSTVLDKVHGS